MTLNALLLPLLGGFLFLSISHRTSYFITRQTPATLSFWLAVVGLVLLAMARGLIWLCDWPEARRVLFAVPLFYAALPPFIVLGLSGIAGQFFLAWQTHSVATRSWRVPVGAVLVVVGLWLLRLIIREGNHAAPLVLGLPIAVWWLAQVGAWLALCIWWSLQISFAAPALAFRMALVGLSYVLALVDATMEPARATELWFNLVAPIKDEVRPDALGTAFLACVLGPLLAKSLNLVYPRSAAEARLFRKRVRNSLERLLYNATQRGKMVMITLEDGKVYCGYSELIPGDARASDAYLEILPMFSGYRESESKQVHLPVNYAAQYRTLPPDRREQFKKVFPVARIVTAGEFDPRLFETFPKPPPAVPRARAGRQRKTRARAESAQQSDVAESSPAGGESAE
jgi:hypothetical protein